MLMNDRVIQLSIAILGFCNNETVLKLVVYKPSRDVVEKTAACKDEPQMQGEVNEV